MLPRMQRVVVWVGSAVLLALAGAPAAFAQEAPGTCVAVSAFGNTSDWGGDAIGAAAGAEVAEQLYEAGEFTIIGPARVRAALEAHEAEALDPFDLELARAVADEVGCPYVVAGRVAEFSVKQYSGGLARIRGRMTRAVARVDVYLLDTRKGEVLVHLEGEGSRSSAGASVREVQAQIEARREAAREALRPALDKVLPRLRARVRTLPSVPVQLTGKVVGVGAEGAVYIDRGANFGVVAGRRFVVTRVLDEIRDERGELLDQIVQEVGLLEVVQVLSRSAVCRVVNGDAIEGDGVRVAQRP